jgi:hypothetical protein
MINDGDFVTLSDDEISYIKRKRMKDARETIIPAGIGVGREWARAKMLKKRFIDEATIVEEKGNEN